MFIYLIIIIIIILLFRNWMWKCRVKDLHAEDSRNANLRTLWREQDDPKHEDSITNELSPA